MKLDDIRALPDAHTRVQRLFTRMIHMRRGRVRAPALQVLQVHVRCLDDFRQVAHVYLAQREADDL